MAFERRLDALLQLEYPNILPVLDWGRHDHSGQCFMSFTMDALDLDDLLNDAETVYRAVYPMICENYESWKCRKMNF